MANRRRRRGEWWRRGTAAGLAFGALLSLSACNTIAGAGRDIEALGRAVADTAQRAKP